MQHIAIYTIFKHGDFQPLNDELAGLTFGSGTDENAVAGKIMSNWSEVLTSGGENGSWEDILKRETRERLEEEAQQEAYQEDPSRGGSGDGSGGLALLASMAPNTANMVSNAAKALGVDQVMVANAMYNSAKEGQADVLTNGWGKNIVFAVIPDSAQKYQISLGYNIRLDDGQPRKVYSQPMFNPPGSTEILVEDEYDLRLSDVTAGYLIKNAIA